ncbi:serine/threonine-protein kinase [Streptomyces sp. NBC_01591]|uniref:protein kinase domain-containing protein n=1 Tax=Streptomyces sp. NBC_01591 TaxID=2975888 RepID=UPI002DD9F1EF|nr:protein kinase [Streptomyces sp. NBC_01591]WSD67280.1 serine/threonine-protein kinase [Streptomyces sp. NBC_01591]
MTRPPTVTLTLVEGRLDRTEYVFDERTTAVLGRARDCTLKLPNDEHHRTVSRHHCLLDINPPDIRIRDFGSLNGTFVNDRKIGQRRSDQTPEEGAAQMFPERDLDEGDEIRVGATVFRVGVEVQHTSERLRCKKCGRDVSGESRVRVGEYLCASCQAEPAAMLRMLLGLAHPGHEELSSIAGFTLLKELGRGGMGAVHLARHEATGKEVALKVMLPKVAVRPESRARFLREMVLTQALGHPSIARLHSSGFSNGTFFFTSKYCTGGSLDLLAGRNGGRVPVDEALRIMLQALEGLDHAHRQGVIHRDLSPSNILLHNEADGSTTAKISDFGLGKAFDRAGLSGLTRTGETAGKPWFMPRQQVSDFKNATPAGDVWALAACLYNILTGKYPRDFARDKDVWQVVLDMPAVPVRERRPSVPRALADVIDKALQEEPVIGFQTAAEFRDALLAAADSR